MSLHVALHHRFAGLALDVGFDAPPGVTALFGRSGSGKTTVVNAVAGLLRPDRGRVVADGAVVLDTDARINLPPHRRRMGYVFQDARLFPHLTVRQNLLYGRWFAPKGPGAELDRVVDMLGLGALMARRPGALSGGETQRVALGRAILSRPRLLLMDEPLAALDDARKEEILPYLERLRDTLHLPILYVSHSLAEVARLATTVALIEGGRLTAFGPTAQVLAEAPGVSLREAGAVLTLRVAAHEGDGLARLEGAAGRLWLPGIAAPVGTPIRLRVLAQDVMLARARPEGVSALNILPVTIRDVRPDGAAGALVVLDAGGEVVLSRITRRSAAALGLVSGVRLFAVLKAVAVASQDVGQGGWPAPDVPLP